MKSQYQKGKSNQTKKDKSNSHKVQLPTPSSTHINKEEPMGDHQVSGFLETTQNYINPKPKEVTDTYIDQRLINIDRRLTNIEEEKVEEIEYTPEKPSENKKQNKLKIETPTKIFQINDLRNQNMQRMETMMPNKLFRHRPEGKDQTSKNKQSGHNPQDQASHSNQTNSQEQDGNQNLQSSGKGGQKPNPFFLKWYGNLEQKWKVAIAIGTILLSIGIVLAILLPIILKTDQIQMPGYIIRAYEANGNTILAAHGQNSTTSNKTYKSQVHGSGVPSTIDFLYESITKRLTNPNNESLFVLQLPMFQLFSLLGASNGNQETHSQWLSKYNEDPREFIINATKFIRKNMTKTYHYKNDQKINDNLTIVSVSEETEIYVEYDYTNQVFIISTYVPENITKNEKQKNKTAQKTDDKKDSTKPNDSTSTDNTKVNRKKQFNATSDNQKLKRVMQRVVWQIKRAAFKSINLLKNKTSQLLELQRKFYEDYSVSEPWQDALSHNCSMVGSIYFRCKLSAVAKLIPGVSQESIRKDPKQYIMAHILRLVFKEVAEKIQ